jgi:hypothetical protein
MSTFSTVLVLFSGLVPEPNMHCVHRRKQNSAQEICKVCVIHLRSRKQINDRGGSAALTTRHPSIRKR